jgi:hypothetical protein
MSGIETTVLQGVSHKMDAMAETVAKQCQWAESIDGRLATLNGTVARHESRLVEVEKRAAVDAAVRTANKERDAAVEKATDRLGDKYQRWLMPVVKVVIGAVGALLLEHGAEIVKSVK